MQSLNSHWGSGPEKLVRIIDLSNFESLRDESIQVLIMISMRRCVNNHPGNSRWPWRLSVNSTCCQNTELALRYRRVFTAGCGPILSASASIVLLYGLQIYFYTLNFIYWPHSAKLFQEQMAQIMVRKIRPRNPKWAKLAFSAASLSIAHASSGARGMKEFVNVTSREHKEPGSLMISWDTTSASSDTWSVSEKQERRMFPTGELVEKEPHIWETERRRLCLDY